MEYATDLDVLATLVDAVNKIASTEIAASTQAEAERGFSMRAAVLRGYVDDATARLAATAPTSFGTLLDTVTRTIDYLAGRCEASYWIEMANVPSTAVEGLVAEARERAA